MGLRSLLACATPLLIVLGLVGLLLRQGTDRLQAVPALVIGISLLLQSGLSRRRRRQALLRELRERQRDGG